MLYNSISVIWGIQLCQKNKTKVSCFKNTKIDNFDYKIHIAKF